MVQSLNFLGYDKRYRFAAIVGDLRSRLLVIGLGAGLGLAIVGVTWFVGDLRIHDIEAQMSLVSAQRNSLDDQRARMEMRLTGSTADLADLLPRIAAIRLSGTLFADRVALLGNVKPKRAWIDTIQNDSDSIKIDGGALALSDVASVMQGLSGAGFDTHVTSVTPKKARGSFLTYEIEASAAAPVDQVQPGANPVRTAAPASATVGTPVQLPQSYRPVPPRAVVSPRAGGL